jgi:hypothetical protein
MIIRRTARRAGVAAVAVLAVTLTAGCTGSEPTSKSPETPDTASPTTEATKSTTVTRPALPEPHTLACVRHAKMPRDILFVATGALHPRRDIVLDSVELFDHNGRWPAEVVDTWIVDRVSEGLSMSIGAWTGDDDRSLREATPVEGRVLEKGQSYGFALRLSPTGGTQPIADGVVVNYQENGKQYTAATSVGLALGMDCPFSVQDLPTTIG